MTQKKYMWFLINLFCFYMHSAELTQNDCLPAINAYKDIKDSSERTWACLKAGLRKIAWDIDPDVTQHDLERAQIGILTLHRLPLVVPFVGTFKKQTIWYNKDPETYKIALLFQKYLLQKELYDYIAMASGQLKLPDNPYAMGSFLNYGLENIEYYYKYTNYITNTIRNIGNESERRRKETALRSEIPSRLATEVNQWARENEALWKPQLENDKKTYDSWMEENAFFPIKSLEEQNKALDKAIVVLTSDTQQPDVEKKLETPSTKPMPVRTTPSKTTKQKTSWWKKTAAFTALAAGAAAIYAYFARSQGASKVPTH